MSHSASPRLDYLRQSLRLAIAANRDVGRDATADLLAQAENEIIALEAGLAVCVDGGTFDMVRDALQEQVDECPDPECEMCARHRCILAKTGVTAQAERSEGGSTLNVVGKV